MLGQLGLLANALSDVSELMASVLSVFTTPQSDGGEIYTQAVLLCSQSVFGTKSNDFWSDAWPSADAWHHFFSLELGKC